MRTKKPVNNPDRQAKEWLARWERCTFAQVRKDMIEKLQDAGAEPADLDANALLGHVYGRDVWQQLAEPMAMPAPNNLAQLARLFSRRLAREPVSQILGEKGFWTLDLAVNKEVLTPRADTETLVQIALNATADMQSGTLLDIGTGSGALLLAFLAERPKWLGVGVDVSGPALEVARYNARSCVFKKRCSLVHANWCDFHQSGFDYLVSNPPYIASDEIKQLDPEVREYEPHLALDGGKDGLRAYRSLAKRCKAWLKPGAGLAFEIGHGQAHAVKKLLKDAGMSRLQTARDLGGRDRVISGQWVKSAKA